MSHKQQYEATDVDYGTENFRTSERFDSANRKRPEMGRKRGKRLNRSTECIVGDVGKWLGNCAQDRRPWLRKLSARADESLRGYCAGILRGGRRTEREQFGNTGKRLTSGLVHAGHRSMIVWCMLGARG